MKEITEKSIAEKEERAKREYWSHAKGCTEERFQALKESTFKVAKRKGFLPLFMWDRTLDCLMKGPRPIESVGERMEVILAEMERRGWDKEAELEYPSSIIRKEEDFPTPEDAEDRFVVTYGGSEGIYIDWELVWYDTETLERTIKHIGHFKSCDGGIATAESMGILAGRLTWLSHELY